MENTARALLIALSYFELWDDDVIDPDTAVSAMENATAELRNSSPEEVKIISKIAKQLAEAAADEDEKEIDALFVSHGLRLGRGLQGS